MCRGLNHGKFHWGEAWHGDQRRLTEKQLSALIQGLPVSLVAIVPEPS